MKKLLVLLWLAMPAAGAAGDWPARMCDAQRSGVSPVRLSFPLRQKWVSGNAQRPRPAWTESPAKHDYLHNFYNMKPRQSFDRCFDVAVVGNRVYFGSTATGAVTCLDNAAGGRVVWTFLTDGPVRFAPHVANGRVTFGSDDGWVYCVRPEDGSLVWKTRSGPSDAMLWGNESMISVWPVRGAVTVADGAVYWSAGIFPQEGVFLCKRDAATGKGGWTVRPRAPVQGYLLTTGEHLIAPTGKTMPYVYACADGRSVGTLGSGRDGGSWALVAPDRKAVWSGPTPKGELREYNVRNRKAVVTIPAANSVVADNNHVYYNTASAIAKVSRSKRKTVWKRPHAYPHALIKAGDHLIAGGKNVVAAIDGNGKKVWSARVDGNVYGLAVAAANLFVSTDRGGIYSFGPAPPAGKAPSAVSATVPANNKHPYPEDALTPLYRKAAEQILARVPKPHRGYCLVFGARTGRLAWELARQSEYTVLGVEEDPALLAQGRKALYETGIYGDRITLHQGSLSKLRYRDYAAALVVSDTVLADGTLRGSASELFRMVRPDGGMAVIGQPAGCPKTLEREKLAAWLRAPGMTCRIDQDAKSGLWAVVRRGPLSGAGEWTHNLGDSANTACSRDRRTTNKHQVLWFGEPGPAIMVDRHWRNVSPLYKRGRLFTPAFDRIVCSDAYNGARLWDLKIPRASRIAMMRDAGWLALADDFLYAVQEHRCLRIDVRTGTIASRFTVPTRGMYWGYLATEGDHLFGSEQVRRASHLAAFIGRGAEGNRLGRLNNQPLITSRSVFCMDRLKGTLLWRYNNPATVIANATIAVLGDGVFFVESTDAKVVADKSGRVTMAAFTRGGSESVVKLDRKTGRVVWRRKHNLKSHHVLHLLGAGGRVLVSGCYSGKGDFVYHLAVFDAKDGSLAWQRDVRSGFGTSDTSHGKQDKHPLIVGDTIYLKQGNFDLATGKPKGFSFKTGSCADYSASASHIYARVRGVDFVDLRGASGNSASLSPVMRPGCYIGTISGGGLVMTPAFSAGCTCKHSIQTSIVWLPR